MKNLINIIIVVLLFSLVGCSSNIADNKEQTVTFLTDINCEKCEAKLFKNIPHEDGIKDLKVDVPNKLVTLTFVKTETNIEKLIQIFKDLGYTATVKN